MKKQAELGLNGPVLDRIGYGAMVLEGYYGSADEDAAIKTLVHAMEAGIMIDTADVYGAGHN